MTLGMLGLLVYALVIVAILYACWEVNQFLRQHEVIAHSSDLEAFKKLARRNMKAVFPLAALFFAGMGLTAQLILQHRVIGFVAILLVNGLVMGSALALSKAEKQARELSCSDPALEAEYRRVSESWLNDSWPRF
ncbi:MAG: hypothetical protein HS116_15620 [Planctomycetes bacterium]|nr:hypothetical protein [Planctomycetota bacterium]